MQAQNWKFDKLYVLNAKKFPKSMENYKKVFLFVKGVGFLCKYDAFPTEGDLFDKANGAKPGLCSEVWFEIEGDREKVCLGGSLEVCFGA